MLWLISISCANRSFFPFFIGICIMMRLSIFRFWWRIVIIIIVLIIIIFVDVISTITSFCLFLWLLLYFLLLRLLFFLFSSVLIKVIYIVVVLFSIHWRLNYWVLWLSLQKFTFLSSFFSIVGLFFFHWCWVYTHRFKIWF